MGDEGLHEIQLNGKQLVFLFMASTIVAVVIFLCGVMVGRGVRVQRPADAIEASVDAATDPTAVNDRHEADTIAKRLAAKGYPSFVTTPPNGTPRTFRVRIGKYPNRRDAESIAARLQKEEQFKPWITR